MERLTELEKLKARMMHAIQEENLAYERERLLHSVFKYMKDERWIEIEQKIREMLRVMAKEREEEWRKIEKIRETFQMELEDDLHQKYVEILRERKTIFDELKVKETELKDIDEKLQKIKEETKQPMGGERQSLRERVKQMFSQRLTFFTPKKRDQQKTAEDIIHASLLDGVQHCTAVPVEPIAKPQTSSGPKGQSMEAQPTAGKGDGPKVKSTRRRLIGWLNKKVKKRLHRAIKKSFRKERQHGNEFSSIRSIWHRGEVLTVAQVQQKKRRWLMKQERKRKVWEARWRKWEEKRAE
ncbi:uncharacterized protein LOC143501222 [Brachyhypopomus gauderio]|uniref:uncharacterized protein LOC143501222 n=1 Tax=Brachyhypopomus gauderio TaxID=698409 RepID=UPI004040F097